MLTDQSLARWYGFVHQLCTGRAIGLLRFCPTLGTFPRWTGRPILQAASPYPGHKPLINKVLTGRHTAIRQRCTRETVKTSPTVQGRDTYTEHSCNIVISDNDYVAIFGVMLWHGETIAVLELSGNRVNESLQATVARLGAVC